MIRTSIICLALILTGLAVPAQASRIYWGSSLGGFDTTSGGALLTGDVYFELGVFKNGFVPTAENTDQWAANWAPAKRVKYHERNRWIADMFTVTDNTAPFTAGTAAYIWGFKGSEQNAEWILFRSPTWTWPAASPTSAVLNTWLAKDATSVVLGQVAPGQGSKFNMRTAAVGGSRLPSTGWSQFRQLELDGKTALTNPNDDADGDGVSNLLEFLNGSSPTNAADKPKNIAHRMDVKDQGGKSYLEVSVPRRRDRTASFTAEVSNDLATWTSGSTAVVADTADALTVRDLTPIGEAGTQRFIRVNVAAQ